MKHTNKIHARRIAAVCAAAVMAVGAASVAYAADVGGIQRSIQLWINGDQTDAVLDIHQDGSYSVTYQDQDGVPQEFGGGGAALYDDGSERPLTENEIVEQLDGPDVQYREDSVWVCYHDRKIDITDRFDEDGVCYVQIETDSGSIYMTVKYGSFSYSKYKYPSPDSFRTE